MISRPADSSTSRKCTSKCRFREMVRLCRSFAMSSGNRCAVIDSPAPQSTPRKLTVLATIGLRELDGALEPRDDLRMLTVARIVVTGDVRGRLRRRDGETEELLCPD